MELSETAKNLEAKEFLKYAGSILSEKKNYTILGSIRAKIQNVATSHLDVKDIFKLRDRYEGQAYLDSLYLKIGALHILEKETATKLIDWDLIINDKNIDLSSIVIDNVKYRIVSFLYGSLPLIQSKVKEPLLFCALKADFRNGIICGVLNDYKFEDKSIFILNKNSSEAKTVKFIGFDKLIDL